MSFESLLQFWTVHNRQIIEFVFVFTFVMILFVIYRQFFSKANSGTGAGSHANTVSIDTTEIEEKLKKILENQSSFKAPSSEPGVVVSNGTADVAADTLQEIDKLKNELKEKEKALEELKKMSLGVSSGVSKDEVKKFDDKIKELEGRLQEYEIIAEDIADLSFYKEENARLQKELSAGGGAKAAPAPVVVEPAPPPKVDPPKPAEPAPVPEKPKKELDTVVDDDILKEFAAAVEGQKSAEAKPAATAETAQTPPTSAAVQPGLQAPPPQPVDEQKLSESKELMGEFENFIKKG